ncbi:MAG: Imm52 family immunity protein [Micromonosporaceae bacterium]
MSQVAPDPAPDPVPGPPPGPAPDRWIFEARWSGRSDDLATCAVRLHRCLTGLASVDPTLAEWFCEVDELALDAAWLTDVLEYRAEPRRPSGWILTLWNGIEDNLAVAPIRIACGSPVGGAWDDIRFQLPRPAGAPALYDLATMRALVEVMVSAWQPDWCRVRQGRFADPDSLRDDDSREPDDAGRSAVVPGSWLVYLARGRYARTRALPSEVRMAPVGDGEVFVLAPTPDELRPETVERLRDAITP